MEQNSAQKNLLPEKKQERNPYFLSYEENTSGYNKVAFQEYFRVFQKGARVVWPYVQKVLNFIIFDGLRFFKSFVRYALKQVGILK